MPFVHGVLVSDRDVVVIRIQLKEAILDGEIGVYHDTDGVIADWIVGGPVLVVELKIFCSLHHFSP